MLNKNQIDFQNYKNFCNYFKIKPSNAKSLEAYISFLELSKVV